MKNPLTIRWRLTVWYAFAMSVILLIFGGLMYALIRQQLHDRIDAQMMEESDERMEEIRSVETLEEIRDLFQKHDFVHHSSEKSGFSFRISHVNGAVICGNEWLKSFTLPVPLTNHEAVADRSTYVFLGNYGAYRLLTRTVVRPHEPLLVQVLVPYSQIQQEMLRFSKMLTLSGGVALLAACVGGLAIADRALQPLGRITQAAERISAENLSMSIAVENPSDELGRLAITLNHTFHRLRDSVDRMQRFTADAAHELRTPLSALWTQLEVALRTQTDEDQLKTQIKTAMEQAMRLIKLSDQLLLLSRLDAGVPVSLFEHVNIKVLLSDVVDVLQTIAVSKCVSLSMNDIPNCSVIGDDVSLSRLFFNIIDNAIKYTPEQGSVTVTGVCDGRHIRVMVDDTGIGIPAEEISFVFNRFYRVNASRDGRIRGSGLGLAICRSIAESHRGEILVSSSFENGTRFTVVLPLEPNRDVERSFAESDQAAFSQDRIREV